MPPSRFLNADAARSRFATLADTYAGSLERGDPLADAAVDALHSSGHGRWWEVVSAALEGNEDAECPAEVKALLASLPPVPSTIEEETYERAAAFVERASDSAGLALTCAALM